MILSTLDSLVKKTSFSTMKSPLIELFNSIKITIQGRLKKIIRLTDFNIISTIQHLFI